MHLKFPYVHTANKEEAYQVFLQQFESEEFTSLEIGVDIEEGEHEIKASGKGFNLLAEFHDTELVMTFDLAFYLKPFTNKIEGKLSSIVSHNI